MSQPTRPGTPQNTRQGSPFARARRKHYIDELMDHYVGWREACAAVAVAYERCRGAGPQDREVTFAIYSAALDREEHAAMAYQLCVALVAAA